MKNQFSIPHFTAICSFVVATLFYLSANAQIPSTVWEKRHGGPYTDGFNAVAQTQDGGYVATGIFNVGNFHYWIQKMDAGGNAVWSKNYGGTTQDKAYTIIQTDAGEYIVGGEAMSVNGDVTGSHGSNDAWILKLDSSGNVIWKKCYGGSSYDKVNRVLNLPDGNFLALGTTSSDDGDLNGINTVGFWGESNIWLMKLNPNGTIIWQKTYGGLSYDAAYDMIAMPDGGFAIAGTESASQNMYEMFISRIDSVGTEIWTNVFGYEDYEMVYALTATDGDDLLIAGTTLSTGFPQFNGGGSDAFVAKLDGSTGSFIWHKAIGGSGSEQITGITPYRGLYVLAGTSSSSDGAISSPLGDWDVWLAAIDDNGTIQWDKNYGGSSTEAGSSYAVSIISTMDSALVVASMTGSVEISGGGGSWDGYIFRLQENSTGMNENSLKDLSIYPNPADNYLYIQTNGAGNYKYNLMDVSGRIVQTGSFDTPRAKIHTETLARGIYFIQLQNEQQKTQIKKIIKQ